MQEDQLKKMIDDLGQEVLSIRLTVDKIHRKMRWAEVYSIIKFCIIVAPLIWAYLFFQPQIQEFYGLYGKMIEQLKNLQTMQQMQSGAAANNPELLKQLQQKYNQPQH